MVKTNKQRYLENRKRNKQIARKAKKQGISPFDLKRIKDEQEKK